MLLLYTTISVAMFNPDNADMTDAIMKMLPEGMVKAFGFEGLGTDLTGYISNYLFGFIYLVFPLIYTVIVANNVICKHVDSGSMTYLLTTPNTRKKIATTQAVYLALSTALIYVINAGVAVIMSELMFPGLLDAGIYLQLNLLGFMCVLVISGFGFFLSCLFNDTKNSIGLGASIPVLFVVLKMVSAVSEETAFLKYFTLYSLVDIPKVLEGGSYAFVTSGVLFILAFAIYAAAIELFHRRSLAL